VRLRRSGIGHCQGDNRRTCEIDRFCQRHKNCSCIMRTSMLVRMMQGLPVVGDGQYDAFVAAMLQFKNAAVR
ncbi:MAG: hypothetical protein ACK5SM_06730, partial [Sphingomonadales bacterium]